MKIVLTGGGTGGHFYPLIAVVEEIKSMVEKERLLAAEFYYFSDTPYDERVLFEHGITFTKISAGKMRRYFSIRNFFDIFKTVWGTVGAFFKLYMVYPDVIFSKGGYVSAPVLLSARLLRIPIVVHESDSKPGRANLWAARFAKKIAISYSEALKYFPEKKTAVTGNPIRRGIINKTKDGATEFLNLEKDTPVILVLGGSLGAKKINDFLVDVLPELVTKYQVIHQTGVKNIDAVRTRADFVLTKSSYKDRYKAFAYLNDTALSMAAGVTGLIISRAGSTIFEIANWEIPSIIIPIPEGVSHEQRTNAYTYAKGGGAVVIEEDNLTQSVLVSEINRIMGNEDIQKEMSEGAKNFAPKDSAKKIAQELVKISLGHEE